MTDLQLIYIFIAILVGNLLGNLLFFLFPADKIYISTINFWRKLFNKPPIMPS